MPSFYDYFWPPLAPSHRPITRPLLVPSHEITRPKGVVPGPPTVPRIVNRPGQGYLSAQSAIDKIRAKLKPQVPPTERYSASPFATNPEVVTEERMPSTPWHPNQAEPGVIPEPNVAAENLPNLRTPAAPSFEPYLERMPIPEKKKDFLESIDEDTRRNLMLSALATGLKLMSSQKYTTVPHSPVAEIGEAGLGGLQTYMTLESADKKYKLAEAERIRKALKDELTARHQEKLEGFREQELRRYEPGGIAHENFLSEMAARDMMKVDTVDAQGNPVTYLVPRSSPEGQSLMGTAIPKPVETVGQKVFNTETGQEETQRISKYAPGIFAQKPEAKVVTGTSGQEKKTVILSRGPGGTWKQTPVMSGQGPSEARMAHNLQMATAEKYYRTEIKDILARANITMTPQEAIQFNQLTTDNLGAFLASKTRTLSKEEKTTVDTALRNAFSRYNTAVTPLVGKQARPKNVAPVNFDEPLTFR